MGNLYGKFRGNYPRKTTRNSYKSFSKASEIFNQRRFSLMRENLQKYCNSEKSFKSYCKPYQNFKIIQKNREIILTISRETQEIFYERSEKIKKFSNII